MNGPTQEQIEPYARDGFLVVEESSRTRRGRAVREHFHACFEHEWETGLRPDEVNYTPGVTPPDCTRQLCNVWKADRCSPPPRSSERNAEFAAQLAGAPGMRLLHDNMVWKPPAARRCWPTRTPPTRASSIPPNMTTCWMALDETHADTGTIYYARGSHLWGRDRRPAASSTRPTTGPGTAQQWCRPSCTPRSTGCRSRCRRAARRSTTAGRFHGSPPNERPDRERRVDHQPHGHHRDALAPDEPSTRSTAATCGRTSSRSTRRSSR